MHLNTLLICRQTDLRRYDSAKFLSLKCSLELKYLDKLALFFPLPTTAMVNGSNHNVPVLFELTEVCTSVTIIHVALVCFIIPCQK